jgi:ribosomal protein S18 acetylase RimI-like enzyme
MRPAQADDLPGLFDLWRREVAQGHRDVVPTEGMVRRLFGHVDMSVHSRVLEVGGALAGAVFLMIGRPSPEGAIARILASGDDLAFGDMVRWGVLASRAAGASIVQVMVAKDHGQLLDRTGLEPVRPWWRMDCTLVDRLPVVAPVAGYELVDGTTTPSGLWSETFDRSFADHWRFQPKSEDEVVGSKPPELCLMALTASQRSPAAITLVEIENYEADSRPQPVGLIAAVGTVPEHRRRGLAAWLVSVAMGRLQQAGSPHASLYVDGLSPTRAYDVYRKLGFEVAYQGEIWEATFP